MDYISLLLDIWGLTYDNKKNGKFKRLNWWPNIVAFFIMLLSITHAQLFDSSFSIHGNIIDYLKNMDFFHKFFVYNSYIFLPIAIYFSENLTKEFKNKILQSELKNIKYFRKYELHY